MNLVAVRSVSDNHNYTGFLGGKCWCWAVPGGIEAKSSACRVVGGTFVTNGETPMYKGRIV